MIYDKNSSNGNQESDNHDFDLPDPETYNYSDDMKLKCEKIFQDLIILSNNSECREPLIRAIYQSLLMIHLGLQDDETLLDV